MKLLVKGILNGLYYLQQLMLDFIMIKLQDLLVSFNIIYNELILIFSFKAQHYYRVIQKPEELFWSIG